MVSRVKDFYTYETLCGGLVSRLVSLVPLPALELR